MKIHIEITHSQHKKLKLLKQKENRTMQYLVSKAIDNFLISKKIRVSNSGGRKES